MRPETLTPGNAYRALLADLFRDLGVDGDELSSAEAALGLTFSADGHTCRLLPHPAIEDRLIVEVAVGHLGVDATPTGTGGRLHELINHLNAAARLEHDWVACVDDNEEVVLWVWRDVLPMSAASVQALLAEGLDRAQALSELLQTARSQMLSGAAGLPTEPSASTAASHSSVEVAGWTGLRG
jgi:hypothetical protein